MSYQRIPLHKILVKHNIRAVHPVADLLPMYSDEEFEAACQDVKANGFLHSVKVDDNGFLLDGRNRLQIGAALSLDPPIERFNPKDPIGYIISENLIRRHLTVGQRAMLADKLATLKRGRPKICDTADLNGAEVGQKEVAAQLGIRPAAISRAHVVAEYAPAAAEIVKRGNMTLETAYKEAARNKRQKERFEKPEITKPKQPIIELQGILERKRVLVPYPEPRGKHTFNRTNQAVDWASWTWNPVTGCLHGCTYCYAREMAYRDSYKTSYPIQFAPLFHHERLDDPVNTKPEHDRPQDGRVFVCSMADLFGEWVPQEWIDKVFDATLRAPDWEYLFLTKFPQRYRRINLPPKAWFGASVDTQKRVHVAEKFLAGLEVAVRWLSVEPMLEPIVFNDLSWCDLLVIGAQSETYQPHGHEPAFAPRFEWVCDLVAQAKTVGTPVYLKPNLIGESTPANPGMQLLQEQPRRRKA